MVIINQAVRYGHLATIPNAATTRTFVADYIAIIKVYLPKYIPQAAATSGCTVTDDKGATDTDSFLLAAAGSCFCTADKMHVESILLGTFKAQYGKVTVTIFDNCGNPVPDAEVTGTFSGDFNETGIGVTDANGTAIIYTTSGYKKASYTFCVDKVVNGSLTYDPTDNVETCDAK